MDLDSFLVSLYVLIDDWWKLDRSSKPPKTGRPALLSDPEVLDPGHPRPVASLPQRAGLLAFRLLSPALLLPYPLLPESVQPAGTGPGARAAHRAARIRPRARLSFGGLPRRGHHPHPGDGEGEGFSQGALLWAGYLRTQRLQDRVGLRLQGGSGGRPQGCGKRLRAGTRGLRRETHRGCPHSLRSLRCLPGRQRLHRGRVGAALDGKFTERSSRPPRRTTPAGRGRRQIGAGPPASARS